MTSGAHESQESERLSRVLLARAHELAGIGTYLIDLDARTIHLSAEMARLLRAGDESLDLSLDEYRRRFHHADDREAAVSSADSAYELGEPLHLEFRAMRGDGAVIWLRSSSTAEHDAHGRRIAIGVVQDVTERRSLESQFRQAQKMEAVGQLAGGVAHDFNNLLAVIVGYTSMLLESLRPTDATHDELDQILRAGQRATELTRALLAFGRRQVLQPKVRDLNEVVAGAEKVLQRVLGANITLAVNPSSEPALSLVDAGQIEQVLLNLAVNARDAMPSGGTLTIEIGRASVHESDSVVHGVAPGEYVSLSVADTGIGMDAATRARVFEPFFTTKPLGRATGLGLAVVIGVVQQSGGGVSVESTPGEGTVFRLLLPATTDSVARTSDSIWSGDLSGTETVLLVDDEDVLRKLARTVLARNGYHVLEARSGGDALVICGSFDGPIHLVLTDIVMPLMSGEQLVDRLRWVRPEMRIAYMSGYPDKIESERHNRDLSNLLAKPFTTDELLRHVRKVLTMA